MIRAGRSNRASSSAAVQGGGMGSVAASAIMPLLMSFPPAGLGEISRGVERGVERVVERGAERCSERTGLARQLSHARSGEVTQQSLLQTVAEERGSLTQLLLESHSGTIHTWGERGCGIKHLGSVCWGLRYILCSETV